LLRVDGLDYEMEVRILRVVRKTKERMKKRELVRKMRKRLTKIWRIIKIMKKWRKVFIENGKVIIIIIEALDIGAKISTEKKTCLIPSVLLWISS
jgi:hypothetical protein